MKVKEDMSFLGGRSTICFDFLLIGLLSHLVMSDSATPWTIACQASLSMGILQARILEWIAVPSSREASIYWVLNIYYMLGSVLMVLHI